MQEVNGLKSSVVLTY